MNNRTFKQNLQVTAE